MSKFKKPTFYIFNKHLIEETVYFINSKKVVDTGQRKFRWPELRGKNGADAKNQINKDAPFVTVVFIRPGQVALPNFCCNRVNVVLDPSGKVSNIPFIG